MIVDDVILGGVIDQSQIWSYSGDALWHEAGNGLWRVSYTPSAGEKIKITAMPHIRSGTGSGKIRLYNKVRIVRVLPTRDENLAINSEALVEFTSGGPIRFFDASRSVFAVDRNPVVGQQNVYAVEVVAGDGVHTEICYGSPLILEV
jgi:hypothetical protein